jgi:hypothetical protein
MVTIVTDIMIFGIKNRVFLKKNDEKSSKTLKIGLKNSKTAPLLPPNSAFWGRTVTGKQQKPTKNKKNRQKRNK